MKLSDKRSTNNLLGECKMKYLLLGCFITISGCSYNSPAANFCLFSQCIQEDSIEQDVEEQIDGELDISPI
jgi:hypothetical protein